MANDIQLHSKGYFLNHSLGATIKILRPKDTQDITTMTQVREYFLKKVSAVYPKFLNDGYPGCVGPIRLLGNKGTLQCPLTREEEEFDRTYKGGYTHANDVPVNTHFALWVMDVAHDENCGNYTDRRLWEVFKWWFPNLKDRYRTDVSSAVETYDWVFKMFQYMVFYSHLGVTTWRDLLKLYTKTPAIDRYKIGGDGADKYSLTAFRHNFWISQKAYIRYSGLSDEYDEATTNHVIPIFALEIFRGVLWDTISYQGTNIVYSGKVDNASSLTAGTENPTSLVTVSDSKWGGADGRELLCDRADTHNIQAEVTCTVNWGVILNINYGGMKPGSIKIEKKLSVS